MHDYDIENVMLELSYDVNIMLKMSWEAMGSPNLSYSPIQLRMENYHIFPIGHLENVEVGLGGGVLFRIKNPCNIESGVTNLLLTCRKSAFIGNGKRIGRKY